MQTIVIRIDMPPKGIESAEDGFTPTDSQMSEEEKARQEFLDFVVPKLASFPRRQSTRQGNVGRVELLGADVWSRLNHYLLLVSVDIGDPGIDWASLVPPGGEVTIIGSYAPLQHWPEDG
jgi:hypothetical protein